jgi:pimeloyl-ACP methyl ester carboxylesterase
MLILIFSATLLFLLGLSLGLSIPLTRRQLQKVVTSPNQYELPFEDVSFITDDGVKLAGWWIPSDRSTRTIIFLHGFRGSMDPDLKYAPAFHNHNYNVLMFDFRAHGRSAGKSTSLGAIEVKDATAAIQFARAHGSNKIGLLGFSMGGRVAILTAADHSKIDAVVSDGGPVRLFTAISEDLKRRNIIKWVRDAIAFFILVGASIRLKVNLFSEDPINKASQIVSTPILFIHGDQDPYTRLIDLDKIVKISGKNSSLWSVKGAGHRETDIPNFEEYISRIISFFDTWMQN